jgi:hypothetical protein
MTPMPKTLATPAVLVAVGLAATLAATLAVPAPAAAQLRPTAVYAESAVLTPAQRTAAIDEILAVLQRTYVFPERVPAIVQAIRAAQARGRYDVGDAGEFASRLTEDLGPAADDSHVYLQHDPERYAAALRPSDAAEAAPSLEAVLDARSRRIHYGLTDQRLLSGNIRYLKVGEFAWVEGGETAQAWDDAMRFLRDGDVVILDIRGNPGGSHEAVRYALSHFMEGGRLLMTFLEAGKAPEESFSLTDLPAGRMVGKPLYVLTGADVGSAGEDFAYSVKQFGLGKLVGETTAGGANNNRFVPIAPGFMLSVSFGRPVHAVGGGNWEGTGVAPDLAVPRGSALETAEAAALDDLIAGAANDASRLSEYEWARAGVQARLAPVTLTEAEIRPRAGAYGDAAVAWREGALWLRSRPGGPERRMLPLTRDGLLFALEGSDMLRARFTPTGLETLWKGEPIPRVFPRTTQ